MALYNVEVRETLSRVVEQEAESYEDAVELVSTRYVEEDIVLDWEDLESTEYKPYPSQEIAEDVNIIVRYDTKNKILNFSNENESIATYDCKTLEEFNNAFKDFFDDYIELKEVQCEKGLEV